MIDLPKISGQPLKKYSKHCCTAHCLKVLEYNENIDIFFVQKTYISFVVIEKPLKWTFIFTVLTNLCLFLN